MGSWWMHRSRGSKVILVVIMVALLVLALTAAATGGNGTKADASVTQPVAAAQWPLGMQSVAECRLAS
jgi:hypothetical protein